VADGRETETISSWESGYRQNWAPWDIGRPQPAWVQLADAGEITSPVLDSGCGTGEHSLLLAARGLDVLGIDISPTAIGRAREKAVQREVDCEFVVGDVLELDKLGRRFRTIVDSAVFHVFDDSDRARYVKSLAPTLEDGGVLHLLCFSEHTPGTVGPRRVTQAELRASFADGWEVQRIEASRIDVRPDYAPQPALAWLARIVRRGGTEPLQQRQADSIAGVDSQSGSAG
jgi:SAM-dependent methyltransferase